MVLERISFFRIAFYKDNARNLEYYFIINFVINRYQRLLITRSAK